MINNEGKKSKKLLTLYSTIFFPKFLEMFLTPKTPIPRSKLESGQKMHFCLGPKGFKGFHMTKSRVRFGVNLNLILHLKMLFSRKATLRLALSVRSSETLVHQESSRVKVKRQNKVSK